MFPYNECAAPEWVLQQVLDDTVNSIDNVLMNEYGTLVE